MVKLRGCLLLNLRQRDDVSQRPRFGGNDWEIALQLALLNERQDEQWEFDQHQAALDEDDRATQETQRADTKYVNRQLFEDMAAAFEKLVRGVPIMDADKAFLKELNREAQKAVLRRDMKTMMEEATEPLHFVEADVIACGPGKRGQDERLLADMVLCLGGLLSVRQPSSWTQHARDLIVRAEDLNAIQPLSVKPGDRILYHPAVQKYDREIEPELVGLKPMIGSKCFIIREESILGVVER